VIQSSIAVSGDESEHELDMGVFGGQDSPSTRSREPSSLGPSASSSGLPH